MKQLSHPNKTTRRSMGVDVYLAHDIKVQVMDLAVKHRRSASAMCGDLIHEALAARSLMARSDGEPSAHVLATLEQQVQGLKNQLQRLEALSAMATAASVLAGREDPKATPEAKAQLQAVTSWSLLAAPGVLRNFNDSTLAKEIAQDAQR